MPKRNGNSRSNDLRVGPRRGSGLHQMAGRPAAPAYRPPRGLPVGLSRRGGASLLAGTALAVVLAGGVSFAPQPAAAACVASTAGQAWQCSGAQGAFTATPTGEWRLDMVGSPVPAANTGTLTISNAGDHSGTFNMEDGATLFPGAAHGLVLNNATPGSEEVTLNIDGFIGGGTADGNVFAGNFDAVRLQGHILNVNVGETGSLVGSDDGLVVHALTGELNVVNEGLIQGVNGGGAANPGDGILVAQGGAPGSLVSGDVNITNYGEIHGAPLGAVNAAGTGIIVSTSGDTTIVNEEGGEITGGLQGIWVTQSAGGGDVEITNHGTIAAGGTGILIDTAGTVFVANTGNTILAGEDGVNVSTPDDVHVINAGNIGEDGDAVGGDGIFVESGGNVTIGDVYDLDGPDEAIGGEIWADNNGVEVSADGTIDIDLRSSTINAGGTGILGTGSGEVTITSGAINSGGSGVVGISQTQTTINVEDKISADGLFGAFALTFGGDSTINVNAEIDPPLIGALAVVVGDGDATVNVNAGIDAIGLGAGAAHIFGTGDANVNVNAEVRADFVGVGTLQLASTGDSNVVVDAAITESSSDDTLGLGRPLFAVVSAHLLNDGDVNIQTTENGVLEAEINAVQVVKVGGPGSVNVDLNADATAGNDVVNIFRTLSGGDPDQEINVDVGMSSPAHLLSEDGNGITVLAPFALNDVNINVGEGSSIIADNGSAISVATFSLLGDNDVSIGNAGTLQGAGTLSDPTISVATDGAVAIANDATGEITTADGTPFGTIIQAVSGDTIEITNDGTMTGNMVLISENGNTVTNNSDETWSWAGLNTFITGGDNLFENTGTANAGPVSVNTFISGGDSVIDNSGTFNADGLNTFIFVTGGTSAFENTGVFNVSGFAGFIGLDDFNNAGGLVDMRNDDIGDIVLTTGTFTGGSGSRLGVDAFLDAGGGSDLLFIGTGTSGSTGVQVNDLNAGPASYDPDGILVVNVLDETPGVASAGDFFLVGGPIDKGFFEYDLYFQGSENSWYLRNTPGLRAHEMPKLVSAAQEIWHESAGVWLDRTADLRSQMMHGVPALPAMPAEPVISKGGDPLPQMTYATPETPAAGPGIWGRVHGASYDRDITTTIQTGTGPDPRQAGYDQKIWGLQAGIDYPVIQPGSGRGTLLIGVMAGYLESQVDFDTTGTDADFSGWNVGAYATYMNGGFFADVLVKADFLDLDYKHRFPGSPAGSTDVTSVGVQLDTGYRFDMQNFFIEPGATLAYVNTDIDDFTVLGERVSMRDGDSLRGRLGVRLGTSMTSGVTRFEPFMTASVWHEFDGDNSAVLSSAPGIVLRDDAGGTWGEIGAGVNVFSDGTGLSGFVKGDWRFGNDVDGGSIQAGLRYVW